MGGATTEEDGLHLFGRMHPDLLLLTQDPEIGSGIRLMRSIHEHSPDTRMLIFLSRETQDVVEEKLQMLSAGGVYCPEDVRRTLVSLDFDQQAKFVEHLREREKEAAVRWLEVSPTANCNGFSDLHRNGQEPCV